MVIVLFVCASCERDEYVREVKISSDKISYNVGWVDGSSATKATGEQSTVTNSSESLADLFLMEFEEDSIFLLTSVCDNKTFAGGSLDADTKASAITSVGSFNVTAFTNSGDAYILKDKITVTNGSASTNRYWPESDPLNFFAWGSSLTPIFNAVNEAVTTSNTAPANGAGGGYNLAYNVSQSEDVVTCGGNFSYILPPPGTGDDAGNDAVNQPDLIFAIAANQTKTSNEKVPGSVELEFHHALSAIHFKIGDMPEGLEVKSVSISGVYSKGECIFAFNPTDHSNLDILFNWEEQSATETYTQKFDLDIPDENREELGTFDEIVGEDAVAKNKEAVFMMVPQTIPEGAKLSIKVKLKGNEKTLEASIAGGKWEADKKYIYTISASGEVDVTVDDQVEGVVKSGLTITNTGSAISYIRAAIVGNWVLVREDGYEDIVADWSVNGVDGTFENLPGTGWIDGADGFYYYSLPVEAGDPTGSSLFESYTLTAAAPVVGAELRLSILVQSVMADRVDEANWPVTVGADGVLSKHQ